MDINITEVLHGFDSFEQCWLSDATSTLLVVRWINTRLQTGHYQCFSCVPFSKHEEIRSQNNLFAHKNIHQKSSESIYIYSAPKDLLLSVEAYIPFIRIVVCFVKTDWRESDIICSLKTTEWASISASIWDTGGTSPEWQAPLTASTSLQGTLMSLDDKETIFDRVNAYFSYSSLKIVV